MDYRILAVGDVVGAHHAEELSPNPMQVTQKSHDLRLSRRLD